MRRSLANVLDGVGDLAGFALQSLGGVASGQVSRRELLGICLRVGWASAGVVCLGGLFIGMVLAVQSYGQFNRLGLSTTIGSVINAAIVKELGPVLTATMLAGRVGAAMAAELATMRVTEQIDALSCLGVHPVRYLVAPRLLACLLMIPMLTTMANLFGVLGAWGICVGVFGIDGYHYWANTRATFRLWDLFAGLIKPFFFGAAIAWVSCHRGFRSTGGAVGVGRAATEAYVGAFLAILVLDFFLVLLVNTLQDQVMGDRPIRIEPEAGV